MIFALTGPSGSGKDRICHYFHAMNWQIIDLDKLGHEALIACSLKLKDRFGAVIIDNKGYVNRRVLGDIVFGNKKALSDLETIVHPWMHNRVIEITNENRNADIVINGSLVLSMKLDVICDFIIYLDTPVITRLLRVKQRDKKSFGSLLKRFFSQRHLKSQIKKSTVDIYNVLNFGNPEKAVAVINSYINDIKRSSHARNK